MPVSFIYVITRSIPQMVEDETFKSRWGAFYDGLRSKSKITLVFKLLFMVRRQLYISFAFNLEKCTFQILGLELINMMMIIYQGNYTPLA